jgi:hypothetical protein
VVASHGIKTISVDPTQPFVSAVGSSIPSASTIAPTAPITPISGTAAIQTITPLSTFSTSGLGGCQVFIATGAWSTGSSGNIATAAFTATSGNQYTACYNNATALWYFQGGGGGGGGGSSTAKFPLWSGAFTQCKSGSSGGTASDSSAWQIGGAAGNEACYNTSGGNPPQIPTVGLTNAAGQSVSYIFDWDITITAVDLHFVFWDGSSGGGNFRFTSVLYCQTLGTNPTSGTFTAGSVSTSSTFSVSTQGIVAVSLLGINIPTCASGSPMILNLTRDQTVSGNSADAAQLHTGSIVITRTLP